MNLYSVWKFKYNEKERFVFITEKSSTLMSGYEINGMPEMAGILKSLFDLLKENDNKSFMEEKAKTNLPPFRRYTISKIEQQRRII